MHLIFGRKKKPTAGFEFGALVHDSARHDAAAAARHRLFIAAHATAGFAALCVLPVYLALFGQPRLIEAAAFALLAAPLATAFYLSRSGRYETAQTLSSANLTALVTLAVALTGGVHSFILPFIALVPLEAAMAFSRRLVAISLLMVGGGIGLIVLFGALAPTSALDSTSALSFWVGPASAVLVAAAAAIFALHMIHEHRDALLSREESAGEHEQLIANLPALITLHLPNGQVVRHSGHSPGRGRAEAGALLGDGLLERVHIADRPAFLSAVRRAAHSQDIETASFRLRGGLRAGADAASPPYMTDFVPVDMSCRAAGAGGELVAAVICEAAPAGSASSSPQQIARSTSAAAHDLGRARFLLGMDHELRTPLNGIIGFSELLHLQPDVSDDKVREYAGLARESAVELLRTVNELLVLANSEAGAEADEEPLDLARLVELCQEQAAAALSDAGVSIDVALPPDLPFVSAPRTVCSIILRHAVLAALDGSEAGGMLELTARPAADTVIVAIASGRIGTPVQDPRARQPLDLLRSGHGQSAYSLPLAESLCQAIGARISASGDGTGGRVIEINLPRALSDSRAARLKSA